MKSLVAMAIMAMLIVLPTVCNADDHFVYSEKNQRDPFWPLVSKSGTMISYSDDLNVSDLFLEGIIADGTKNLAIINGNIVGQNDEVGQFTIVDINKHQVTVMKNNEKFTLTLQKEE